MSQLMSDSRFHMWRAVLAMAHIDGNVSNEEIEFAQQYFERAPFSAEQMETLRYDLQNAQNVSDMLKKVSDLSDQADFFQFSHMLAWKDGDYSSQEENLMNKLTEIQKEKIDREAMARNMREARKAAILRRAIEDEKFEKQAKDVSGFANVMRYILPWIDKSDFDPPDSEMFKLWRAVFSLVHADDDLADEERDYIEGMTKVFHFSDEQCSIIHDDLDMPKDTLELFKELKNKRHRKQFFIMARTIIWCDGLFHDKEKGIIHHIKDHLGDDQAFYESELRWIDRKPDELFTDTQEEDAMMKNVVRQMLDFYKQNDQDEAA